MKKFFDLLSAWLVPEPEITVTADDVDPRRLNVEIKTHQIVPMITQYVVYRDGSIGIYENGCLFASSPVIIWA